MNCTKITEALIYLAENQPPLLAEIEQIWCEGNMVTDAARFHYIHDDEGKPVAIIHQAIKIEKI